MYVGVETVTPALAAAILGRESHNRQLVEAHVDRLASDMRAGHWQQNGQGLVFDDTGALVDGQHRLHAIVRSGTTHQLVVVRGVAPTAIVTMDTGRPRRQRDVLSLHGFGSTHQLGAAVNICWSYDRHGYITRDLPTPTEGLHYAQAHPELQDSLAAARPFKNAMGAARPGAVHFLVARRYGRAVADRALRALAGEGLTTDDPIYHLRRRLDNHTVPHAELLPLLAKACSLHARGVPTRLLRVAAGEQVEV